MRKFRSIAMSLGKTALVAGSVWLGLTIYGNTENLALFIALQALWNTYRDDQQ